MNPCRCGHLGDPGQACARALRCAADYQARVSGPLLDRIDLHVEVAGVSAADLSLPLPAEGSAAVACRAVQTRRFNDHGPRTNCEADGELLDEVATLDEPADCSPRRQPRCDSARGYHGVLRVARTIVDLAGRRRSAGSTSPKRSAIEGWRRAIEFGLYATRNPNWIEGCVYGRPCLNKHTRI